MPTAPKIPQAVLDEMTVEIEAYGKRLEEQWLNTPSLWEGDEGDHIFDLPAASGANDEGWVEGEHERKSNGEFGTGSVSLAKGQSTEQALRDPKSGAWKPDRAAWHQATTNSMVEAKTPTGEKPKAQILGGGSASGKSSLIKSGFIKAPDEHTVHIDSDAIKELIPEFESLKQSDPDNAARLVHEESSYMAKLAIAKAVMKKLDILFDGTGKGKSTEALIKQFADEGYDVHLAYADAPVEVAQKRAEERGRKTGRNIPAEVLAESHTGAAANFVRLKESANVKSANLWDTRSDKPKLVYSTEGKKGVVDPETWAYYTKKAGL